MNPCSVPPKQDLITCLALLCPLYLMIRFGIPPSPIHHKWISSHARLTKRNLPSDERQKLVTISFSSIDLSVFVSLSVNKIYFSLLRLTINWPSQVTARSEVLVCRWLLTESTSLPSGPHTEKLLSATPVKMSFPLGKKPQEMRPSPAFSYTRKHLPDPVSQSLTHSSMPHVKICWSSGLQETNMTGWVWPVSSCFIERRPSALT